MSFERRAPLALLALLLSGCHAAAARSPLGPDQQSCAERGLVGMNDEQVLSDARVLFEAGCGAGDPAACSVLGRMLELGSGLPRDRVRARALYEQACAAGNVLACNHLAGLLGRAGGAPPGAQPRDAGPPSGPPPAKPMTLAASDP